MSTPESELTEPAPRRALWAWCLYDWSTQGVPTVITTFVFAAYFVSAVQPGSHGATLWAWTIGTSAFAVALVAPLLGAIADSAGRRKPWIGGFTAACIVATALLWYIEPDPTFAAIALILVGIGNFTFETGTVFYNAMIRDLVPRTMIGRLSGWGYGAGYLGGFVSMVVALFLLIQPDPPLFGLDKETSETVRATAILVAIWFAVFSIPFFLITPDRPARRGDPRDQPPQHLLHDEM